MSPSLAAQFTNSRRFQALVGAGCIFLLLVGLWTSAPTYYKAVEEPLEHPAKAPPIPVYGKGSADGRPTYTFYDGSVYQKPSGTKIYGLVFYGRWDRVQILDCYLKKNLARNGGFLDKVVFISNTAIQDDLMALKKLLQSEPDGYVLGKTMPAHEDSGDFHNTWEGLDPDVLYVKIDDDIVYIHDDAIPSMIRYRITNPEYFIVSANVINNPALSWVHERLGAVHPFLPEKTPPSDLNFEPRAAIADWKISSLPYIKHSDADITPPNKPHRWLPVDTRTHAPFDLNNDNTPMSKAEYNAWGPGWNDWRLAAQQHYSFFQNAEQGIDGLKNYWFERWDMNYDRLSINFIAIWGKDVLDSFPMPRDDEAHLTQTMPKKLGRHVVIHGHALVSHYSFGAQKEGLGNTDVLERYRSYAKETCGKLLA